MKQLSKYIFLVYIVWFLIGLVLVSFDILPVSLQWANAFFLYLAGLVSFFYLIRKYRFIQAVWIVCTTVTISVGLEYLGVTFGILFGDYRYENDFGLQIAGVPLTIAAAWLVVITSSSVITRRLLNQESNIYLYVILSSLLAVMMDLAIDPVAFQVKQYWIWEQSGWYFGVPFQNFAGWFITSAIIQAILYRIWVVPHKRSECEEKQVMFVYFSILLLFIMTAVVGRLVSAAILPSIFGLIVLVLLKRRG